MNLEFDSSAHVYHLDGRRVPSVTQVLSVLEDWDRIPYSVLEAARIFGQHVHEACALLVREELDWGSLDPALVPYMLGAKRFLEESGITIIASEERVADKKLGYAGTYDIIGELRGSIGLFDFKSGAVPKTVGAQTAAYQNAYRAMGGGLKIGRRYCIQLRENDYRVTALTNTADFSIFVSALNCFRFKETARAA